MNYETLLSIVNLQLRPDNLRTSIDQLQKQNQFIIAHQEEINSELRSIAHNHNSTIALQHHQEMLTQLSNSLFYYGKTLHGELPENDKLQQFYTQTGMGFDNQLNYILKNYPNFVSLDLPVPYSYGSVMRTELQLAIDELILAAPQKKIEPPLLELILRPIKEIIHQKENMVTQGSLLYNQTLLQELIWLIRSSIDETQINTQIHYILLHLNFNSFEYYFYCTNKLRHKLQEKKNKTDRLEFLSWYEKEITTNPYRSKTLILHQDQQSLASQMLSWIEEEKKYLQLLHDSGQIETISESMEHDNQGNLVLLDGKYPGALGAFKFNKLNTSLTVYELALMVRLYIDAGIITNSTTEEVMEFITHMLTTKKTKSLASASFKNKFYKPSLKTLVNCRNWLQKLQEQLKKYGKNRV